MFRAAAEGMVLVVVAFGTRGDVQPLAVIARAWVRRSPSSRCVFVSHREHSGWLASLIEPSVCAWSPSPAAVRVGQTGALWDHHHFEVWSLKGRTSARIRILRL